MAKETKKIEDLSNDELVAEITAQTETLFKYRFQLATGQLENPMKLRGIRKQIARLKTAQRMRELTRAAAASA
jgi:large subunit ribosomal protein L29